MTDFSAIDNILVTFGSHQEADAQKQLIDSYGGFLDELDPLFTDPINKDTLKADVVDQIKALIIKELIVPVAIDTDDLAIIASIVRECPFKVSHSGLPSTRLTKRSFEAALKGTLSSPGSPNTVEISISLKSRHFPLAGCSFLDWGVFSKAPYTMSPPTAAIAGVTGAVIPGPPTVIAAEMKEAFTDAITAALVGVTGAVTPGPPTISFADVTAAFSSAIPGVAGNTDARAAYDDSKANKIVLRSLIEKHCDSGFRYHVDPPDRLFMKEGTLFLLNTDQNEKGSIGFSDGPSLSLERCHPKPTKPINCRTTKKG